MSDTFRFWTHGASVIAEYTKEYTGTDNGLYMRRAGWGAQIDKAEKRHSELVPLRNPFCNKARR